jgi:hypothetical protein
MHGKDLGASLWAAVEDVLGKHRQPKHANQNNRGEIEREIERENKEGMF